MGHQYDKSKQVERILWNRRAADKADPDMVQLVEALTDIVNGGGHTQPAASFVFALVDSHRTLQQGVIRLMMEIITTYWVVSDRDSGFKHPTGFDARNIAAVELCRKLADLIEDQHLPVI